MPVTENVIEPTPEVLEAFLKEVMSIQRKFGTDMRGAASKRKSEIRRILDKLAGEGDSSEN